MTVDDLNKLTESIIGAAIEVHRHLGPGLLESVYETCLEYELKQLNLKTQRQKALPIIYKQLKLDQGFRTDLIVEDQVIVEIKAVDALSDVHYAQVLSYLKISGCKIGLLMNFNVKLLKDGLHRFIL